MIKHVLIVTVILLALIKICILLFLGIICKKKKRGIKLYDSVKNNITSTKDKRINNCLTRYANGLLLYELGLIGRIPSRTIRTWLLKNIFCVSVGKNVTIYRWKEIRNPWNIQIGDGTIIGDDAILDGRHGIHIGKNCNFSTGVWIWTEQHDYNDPYFNCTNKGGGVVIGDRAWISSRTTILPNIRIGEGTVIAAGAVVTKDCDQYAIYGGVPAKRIKERTHNLEYEFSGKGLPFI